MATLFANYKLNKCIGVTVSTSQHILVYYCKWYRQQNETAETCQTLLITLISTTSSSAQQLLHCKNAVHIVWPARLKHITVELQEH